MKRLELKIPPGVAALTAAVAMVAGAAALPGWSAEVSGAWIAGASLLLCGGAVAAAGVVQFRRARTTLNPLRPGAASTLVDGGVYRFTRNPMYLGMALILAGLGAWLCNPLAVPVLAGFVWYLDRFQIRPEERRLEEIFGERFNAYRHRVRRWL